MLFDGPVTPRNEHLAAGRGRGYDLKYQNYKEDGRKMIKYDYIYIIGTVNIRTVSYRMVTRPPQNLKPNEFAYKLEIGCDMEAWKNRIMDVKLPVISPQKDTILKMQDQKVGKTLGEITIDRMST